MTTTAARPPQAPPALFRRCLGVSVAAHLLLLGAAYYRPTPPVSRPVMEVDLSLPILGGDGPAKLGAPKKLVPKATGIPLPSPTKTPLQVGEPEKPKEWTTATPETKKVEAPPEETATPGGTAEGTGTSHLPGGSGEGSDYGVPGGTGHGGTGLTALPKLLNLDEVRRSLRRHYPEAERRAGREADVRVYLHIGTDGRVSPVEVVVSGGNAFDEAAKKVGTLMRFSPALGRSGPVPVKLPQTILFRLED